jgi:hypothetical protein
MRRANPLAVFLTVALLEISVPMKAEVMTDNQKNLNKAKARIKEFEAEREPERLREASLAIDDVNLPAERDPETRGQLRSSALSVWLQLLGILDRYVVPNFNPKDVPQTRVQPPPTSGGIVYPPGADPELIDDPKARAEYKKAIAENNAKTDRYRLQVELGRMSERISQRAKAFIKNSYTSSEQDQHELKSAIEKEVKDAARKADLLSVSRPNHPN